MDNQIREHESGNYFDFSVTNFGRPEFTAHSIRVPVFKFQVWRGFAHYTENKYYDACVLVYEGVSRSIRFISEYTSLTRKEFGKEYTLEDGPFSPVSDDTVLFLFDLEGVSEDLNAWVSWEIIGQAVRVEEV